MARNDIDLTIRQQPREALQVTPGREKRKTIRAFIRFYHSD
jgi:hypothetical protein